MNDHIQIIITSARETARTILLSKKKLKLGIALSVVLLLVSVIGAAITARLYITNSNLNAQVSAINLKLIESTQENRNYADRIDNLLTQNTTQSAAFEAEKEALLNQTLAELNDKNELIENIVKNIGVKLKKRKPTANSGGPFIPPSVSQQEDLLLRTDKNLNILRRMPLGRPLPGAAISSPFGYREDPINGQKGFHSGVDMQANRGDKVLATADGKVTHAGFDGAFGHLVEIRHGNGFSTRFAHLQEYKVKKGDSVKRGQIIGLVGSSGRATGVHLHYELCQNGKPINPVPFMQTAELSKESQVEELRAMARKKIIRVAATLTEAKPVPFSTPLINATPLKVIKKSARVTSSFH